MLDLTSFSPSNFGRYVSQTEQNMEETIDIDEWTQGTFLGTAEIPPLMSIPTNSLINVSTSLFPLPIADDAEPVPIPHHGPGPIQRPNKLTTTSSQPSAFLNGKSTIHSPDTPDPIKQINQIFYDHGSSSPGASLIGASHLSVSSPMISDLTSPSIPWTPFALSEWQSKNESSWPLTTLHSPTMSMTTHTQNPFLAMSTMNERQRHMSRGETPVWSSNLTPATPARFAAPGTRTQTTSTWNELFTATVPSSNEPSKATTNGWSKIWPAPEPSENDGPLMNGQETVNDNQFWDLGGLSTDSVVPSSSRTQAQSSTVTWWPTTLSDENNNKNAVNHDSSIARDQSRWDFAR